MNRRIFARLGLGAALCLTSGMLMVGSGVVAHAATPGPTGCVAQGANGGIAAGTLTDSLTQPSQSPPSSTCTYVQPAGTGGGFGGADSAGWSITVTGATAPPAKDATGATPCGFASNGSGGWVVSGKGQADGGFGCLPAGDTITASAS